MTVDPIRVVDMELEIPETPIIEAKETLHITEAVLTDHIASWQRGPILSLKVEEAIKQGQFPTNNKFSEHFRQALPSFAKDKPLRAAQYSD